jgi:hypothetical protein
MPESLSGHDKAALARRRIREDANEMQTANRKCLAAVLIENGTDIGV